MATLPDDFPILVNETLQTVDGMKYLWGSVCRTQVNSSKLSDRPIYPFPVSAGVPQRVLLNYLAKYKNGAEPMGWTLPAFSWFIDQTIGGAVSTGTHGSTMRYGSLSSQVGSAVHTEPQKVTHCRRLSCDPHLSQVLSMDVVLANGTLAVFTPEKDPHLFKALGVSAGRLGVITKLKMRIVPQKSVRKTSKVCAASRSMDSLARHHT